MDSERLKNDSSDAGKLKDELKRLARQAVAPLPQFRMAENGLADLRLMRDEARILNEDSKSAAGLGCFHMDASLAALSASLSLTEVDRVSLLQSHSTIAIEREAGAPSNAPPTHCHTYGPCG